MAGGDDLVVYMQTAVKYNTFYIHHPGGAKRPRASVYTNCCILQQFAYTPPDRPHQPFPYFFYAQTRWWHKCHDSGPEPTVWAETWSKSRRIGSNNLIMTFPVSGDRPRDRKPGFRVYGVWEIFFVDFVVYLWGPNATYFSSFSCLCIMALCNCAAEQPQPLAADT